LEVVKDKAGKAIALIKGRAGNIAEIVTETVATVALTGMIAIAGVMMGCDPGNIPEPTPGPGKEEPGNPDPNKPDEKDDEWKRVRQTTIFETAVPKIESINTQAYVNDQITAAVSIFCIGLYDMNNIVGRYIMNPT
jgi:hypothetical protein